MSLDNYLIDFDIEDHVHSSVELMIEPIWY
jgi:hypothetical protein